QLPVLTVYGKETIAESAAILRYVGKLTHLYPDDHLKAAQVDEVVDAMRDAIALLIPSLLEKDEQKKKAMREELAEGKLCEAYAKID
ncbi:unnamed protein product, partial [Phaeothamnion confervicola]